MVDSTPASRLGACGVRKPDRGRERRARIRLVAPSDLHEDVAASFARPRVLRSQAVSLRSSEGVRGVETPRTCTQDAAKPPRSGSAQIRLQRGTCESVRRAPRAYSRLRLRASSARA